MGGLRNFGGWGGYTPPLGTSLRLIRGRKTGEQGCGTRRPNIVNKFVGADSMNAERSVISRLKKCNEYENTDHAVSVAKLEGRGSGRQRLRIAGEYTAELHLARLILTACHLDSQKIRIIRFSVKIDYIDNLKFGCCYLQYVPAPKGTAVAQWLRCCATNRKVAGSIPVGVSGFFM